MMVRWTSFACLWGTPVFLALCGGEGCARRSVGPEPQKQADQRTSPSEPVEAADDSVPAKPQPPIVIPDDGEERWLYVTRAREGTHGGWATGSFDPARNKITIDTYDVERFAVDTGRIPIDWERGVVLRLNGSNSELRKRDYPILQFVRNKYGVWVVLEP